MIQKAAEHCHRDERKKQGIPWMIKIYGRSVFCVPKMLKQHVLDICCIPNSWLLTGVQLHMT